MPKQAWSQGLATQKGAGTLFNTYTTAKTVINQEALYPIGANSLTLGDSYCITVDGGISTLVTTPGTITFQVNFAGPIVVWTSGAIQLNATAHTTLPFRIVINLSVQLLNTTVGGAVAKFAGQAVLQGTMFTKTIAATDAWGRVSAADTAVSDVTMCVPTTAPALGAAFDSTISQTFDFFVGFSVNNAANGIQISQYRLDGNN